MQITKANNVVDKILNYILVYINIIAFPNALLTKLVYTNINQVKLKYHQP